MNLFCLPYAGASYYSYNMLEKYFTSHINFISVELPGHGKRFKESLLSNINEMVDDFYEQIKSKLNESYAFYCHSMGALIGYLLCLKIHQDKLLKPLHLFVSGRSAPSCPHKEIMISSLPNDEFISRLIKYGGIPKEVLKEKELLELFIPILRADFKAVETYHYKKNNFLIDVPITVMIGKNDILTSYEEALRWQDITKSKIFIIEFSGGHFFIIDNWCEIARIIHSKI